MFFAYVRCRSNYQLEGARKPARGRKKTNSKSLGQLKISNGQLQVRKKTMSVAKKTISMALRKPCPWPETGTSEGGLHKKLLKCSNYVNYKAGAHDPGHWPLAAGTPGADSKKSKAPSPSTAPQVKQQARAIYPPAPVW
jgi:hypothetical protein